MERGQKVFHKIILHNDVTRQVEFYSSMPNIVSLRNPNQNKIELQAEEVILELQLIVAQITD